MPMSGHTPSAVVLHSVNLTVGCLRTSIAFYRAVFDLPDLARTADGKHALFMLANTMVELHEVTPADEAAAAAAAASPRADDAETTPTATPGSAEADTEGDTDADTDADTTTTTSSTSSRSSSTASGAGATARGHGGVNLSLSAGAVGPFRARLGALARPWVDRPGGDPGRGAGAIGFFDPDGYAWEVVEWSEPAAEEVPFRPAGRGAGAAV